MFDKKAIKKASECVAYIKKVGNIKRGKTRLNYGKGERYGNTPVEYSIIFEVNGQHFHFFTSDFRWFSNMTIRTCEDEKDFHGGSNYNVEDVADVRHFVEQKVAGRGVVYC